MQTEHHTVPLNILHVFRAPAGGLFRHVLDLVGGQIEAGHNVGIVCASNGASDAAQSRLAELAPKLSLGLRRLPMSRLVHPMDITAIGAVRTLRAELNIDIIHGHGAKGGLMARLATSHPPAPAPTADNDKNADRHVRAVYTPHGGSLHYDSRSLSGFVYLTAERLMRRRTDAFIFESKFARDTFTQKVGAPQATTRIVHNGLAESEFSPLPHVHQPDVQRPYDIGFVGELRLLKGVDVLLDALATMRGRQLRVIIAGDGPDRDYFIDRACALGLAPMVSFPGAMPARDVFAMSKMLVVPSLAESLPYIVLEAIAVGLPLLTTNVGGIPEIFGDKAHALLPAGDGLVLADAITGMLAAPELAAQQADALKADIANRFSLAGMVAGVEEVYRTALQDTATQSAFASPMKGRPGRTIPGA